MEANHNIEELETKIDVIHKKVETNVEIINAFFKKSEIIVKKITETSKKKVLYAVIYLDNSIDLNLLNRDVLKPIRNHVSKGSSKSVVISELEDSIGNITEIESLDEAMDFLVQGFVLFFADGSQKAWAIEFRGFPRRAIKQPDSEVQVRGPQLGFSEIIGENNALIRRYLKSSELKFKTFVIGTKSKTIIELVYVETLIKKEVLSEIEKRIKSIKIDTILGTGQINEYITDSPNSPFPQLLITQRVDKVVANILEGRAAILIDGQPDAIILPATFPLFFMTLDEYNTPWIFGSLLRLVRWGCFIVAVFLPGFYIAIVSLNHEIVPLELLIIISQSRTKVPFHPLIEAILMEVTIEILREAGVRLPGSIGQTIGIVGAIVIGEAAVQAGLSSNVMVIVVAVTGIATFVLPVFEFGLALRYIRFPNMVLASLFGFIGLFFMAAMILIHLCTLETVNKPYLTPITPFKLRELQDTFIRLPSFTITKRPSSAVDKTRSINTRRKRGNNE